jgi:copper chaperone
MHPTILDSAAYRLAGLTCEHCRVAVTEAVAQVAGVESVDVDLAAGRMRVVGHRFDDAAIAAAVAAEGYEVAS